MKDTFVKNTLVEDLYFTFVLLRDKPMVARIADNSVGYFTSQYKSVGISDIAKQIYGFDDDGKISNDMIDKNIRLINRVNLEARKEILYYIDPSLPSIFRQYVRKGVENWNVAFNEAGFSGKVIRAILPDDPEFPADYDAGNILFLFLSFVCLVVHFR